MDEKLVSFYYYINTRDVYHWIDRYLVVIGTITEQEIKLLKKNKFILSHSFERKQSYIDNNPKLCHKYVYRYDKYDEKCSDNLIEIINTYINDKSVYMTDEDEDEDHIL